MAIGGPNPNRAKTSARSASPIHFLRILRDARAYRRFLFPAIVCTLLVALAYSMNIMALLPMIQVIASDRGLPSWIDQWVAEQRLGVVFDAKGEVLKIQETHSTDWLRVGDRVTALNGEEKTPDEFFRRLAQDESADFLRISVSRPRADAPTPIRAELRPTNLRQRAARWSAQWLPAEPTHANRMRTLTIIVIGALVIAILGGVCRYTGEYLIAMVAARTVVGIRRRMYRNALRFPLSYFAQNGISDTISRFVQDSQEVYRGLNFMFAKTLREPLKALFVFGWAMIIDPRITLLTLLVAPIAGWMIRQMGRRIRKANKRLLEGYSRMLSALEGALTGIRVVKGYTMENYERSHLFTVDQHMLKQQLRIARIEALSSPAFEMIGRIVATLAILYFADQMFRGLMDISRLGALAACMAAMFDPVRQMSSFYTRMQRANAAADRMFELLDVPIEHERPGAASRVLPPLRETIEFRGVRYTYPGADAPALDGVDLTVHRGERVAVVGPNGSGKTTLLSVLMRFFEPDDGDVCFDGRDVRDYSIASLRRQMSLITQDSVIFAETLAGNIAYGDEKMLRRMVLQRRHPERRYDLSADRERIIAAARAAYADEFIREKPDGYDTIVGEQGVTLSGGQKQRLAIARAMLRNAPIFIFDEATSQIDSESEQKIHDAVERFLENRTAFIIAHRFATILQADRIVVMDRGRIIDSGRHEELIRRCGLYQSLYGTQIFDKQPVS